MSEIYQRWTDFEEKNGSAGCNHTSRPATKPAMRAMWRDDSDRLWVERYDVKGFAFDVFVSKGKQIATIPAPDRVADVEPTIVGNRLALLILTKEGIPVVRGYRIAQALSGK